MADEIEISKPGTNIESAEIALDVAEFSKATHSNLSEGTSGEEESKGGKESDLCVEVTRESSSGSRSIHSSQSRISMSPFRVTSKYGASKLSAYQAGAIENAVSLCKQSLVTPEDGDITGSWLLADIDHWDLEREKLVILTTNSLLVIQFNFITPGVKYFKRIPLKSVESVDIGDFTYPSFSVMSVRDYGGIRIHWSKTEPWFYQRWNPWCDDVGFITLTHHLLVYNDKERETATFNISDFADSVVQAVNENRRRDDQLEALAVNEGPITIYSYANVGSLIYNQSHIGFNMDRGGVSF